MNEPPPSAFPTFGAANGDQTDTLTLVGLTVAYRSRGREHEVLQDVTLHVKRGEAYGLVGESGCGKSTAALAMLRYLPRNGRVKAGKISIAGHDVSALDADALRGMRANAVSMVYQDPRRALNRSLTIAQQVSEVFEVTGASADDALARTADMLKRVRIASPERVIQYPHQLSGGMQQRVAIAQAFAGDPRTSSCATSRLPRSMSPFRADRDSESACGFAARAAYQVFISHDLNVVRLFVGSHRGVVSRADHETRRGRRCVRWAAASLHRSAVVVGAVDRRDAGGVGAHSAVGGRSA